MEDNERIINCHNSISKGFGPGKDNPISLHTDNNHVYRVTGINQIKDVITCGYIRPKGYGKRSEKVGNVVYWSIGNDKLYYIDKRPVLEVPIEKISDGQLGAISINDLSAIYIFDEDKQKYINYIEYFLKLYDYYQNINNNRKGR